MSVIIKDIYEAFNIKDNNKANVNKFFAVVMALDKVNTDKCISLFKEYKLSISKMSELKIFLYDADDLRLKIEYAKSNNLFVELMNNITILLDASKFVNIKKSASVIDINNTLNIEVIKEILSKPQTSVFTSETYDLYDKLLEIAEKIKKNLKIPNIDSNVNFEKNLQKLIISGIKKENEIIYYALTFGVDVDDQERSILFNTIEGVR